MTKTNDVDNKHCLSTSFVLVQVQVCTIERVYVTPFSNFMVTSEILLAKQELMRCARST